MKSKKLHITHRRSRISSEMVVGVSRVDRKVAEAEVLNLGAMDD
jgi:hypothetical protein